MKKQLKLNNHYEINIDAFIECMSNADIMFLETTIQKYVRIFGIPEIGIKFNAPDHTYQVSEISIENEDNFFNVVISFEQLNDYNV